MFIQIIPVFFLLLGFSRSALVAEEMKFKRLNVGDGLSQNTITCILQDRTGFMWFGTEDGLNRFDGYTFSVFRNDPSDQKSLSYDEITSICEDRSGILWIGTNGGGLNAYDPVTELFCRFRKDTTDAGSLSHDTVTVVYEDRLGNLWVGTAGGLDRIDLIRDPIRSVQFKHYRHDPENQCSLSYNYITSIHESQSGLLWIGTDFGLNRLDPDNGTCQRYYYDKKNNNTLGSSYILCSLEDHAGNVWIGTDLGGLNLIREEDQLKPTFNRYAHHPGIIGSLSGNSVYALYEDPAGQLWIGTDQGLNWFHANKGNFSRYENDPDNPSSLSNNMVRSIYKDRSGALWIGTDGGINQYCEDKKPFLHYKHELNHRNSLSQNYVWSMCEDRYGDLWIATDGGLDRFIRKENRFVHYQKDPKNPYGLLTNYILSICEDQSGTIWVGSNGFGLYQLIDRGSWQRAHRFQHYLSRPDDPNSLSSNYVMALYPDRSGNIWIGTWDNGIDQLIPGTYKKGAEFIHFRHDLDDPGSLSSNRIYIIYQDRSGTIWIGTDGGGLDKLLLSEKTGSHQFVHFRNDPDNPMSLSKDCVMSIYEDSKGRFWIGTYGGGLNQMDRASGTFKSYTVKQGLPNNVIYGILEDDHGNLWMSTNMGIVEFDPELETFQNYNVNDGLQDYEFNTGAYCKGSGGEMFFGGINGFNAFHPDSIRPNPYVPPVVITDFKLFNESVPVNVLRSKHAILKKAVSQATEIHLSYKENTITFEFAALSYICPEENQYRTILENLERKWNENGHQRTVTYAKLPPGKYIFRVQGSNNDGIWNKEGRSVRIMIAPPFWQTTWFRVFVVFLFIAFSLVVFEWRTNMIRKRARELQIKVEERTRDLETANKELQVALDNVKTLSGLVPICASCKKIRDDKGYWHQVEEYIHAHSNAQFSHGLCPVCFKKMYPEFEEMKKKIDSDEKDHEQSN